MAGSTPVPYDPPPPDPADAAALLDAARASLWGPETTPVSETTRLGRAALQAARASGQGVLEAVAHFYALNHEIRRAAPAQAAQMLDAAIRRCRELHAPHAVNLLQLTRVTRLQRECRFVEAAQLISAVLEDTEGLHPAEIVLARVRDANICKALGRYDELFESSHRTLAEADQSRYAYTMAVARVNHGAALTETALDPQGALPPLQQAHELLLPRPVTVSWVVGLGNRIQALYMLGRYDEAYAAFTEGFAKPGALAMAPHAQAQTVLALIGVGRLDEAERWLGPERADAVTSMDVNELMHNRASRMRLLCAQRRFAEARDYAQATLEHTDPVNRDPTYVLAFHDLTRQACLGLGDAEGALRAAVASRKACRPVVRMSARARFLVDQLNAGLTGADALRPIDLSQLDALQRAVQARESEPDGDLRALAPAHGPAASLPPFVAYVAHELRNPIGGVVGMAELLMRTDLDERQRRFVKLMAGSADTLLLLVNDLLDLAKLESGRFEFKPSVTDVGPWLQDTVAPFVEQAGLKALALHTALDANVPAQLVFDGLRLRQVVANLLSNALKFTRQGQVDVSLRLLHMDAERRATVRLEVRDTGSGIPQAALGRLFQDFVQAHAGIAHTHGGTGLGLALCRQLVQRQGGRIGAESEEGVGSCFWFEITFEQPQPAGAAAGESAAPCAS